MLITSTVEPLNIKLKVSTILKVLNFLILHLLCIVNSSERRRQSNTIKFVDFKFSTIVIFPVVMI